MHELKIERMITSSKSNVRGFSLIEILISLAILGFGLLSIAKLQGTLITGSDHARQITEAINIGQDKLEELRSFFAIDDGTGTVGYVAIGDNNDTVAGENASYARAWTVTDSPDNNYKTINLTVSWTDQNNEDRTVTLTSQVSRSDPATSGKLMLADGAGEILFP